MTLLQRQVPFHLAMGVLLLASASRPLRRCASVSSTRWCHAPNWTPRCSAGSTTCSPARRSRCAPSSRSCAAPRNFPPPRPRSASAGGHRGFAIRGRRGRRARLPREAQAGVASSMSRKSGYRFSDRNASNVSLHALRHHRRLHRREGQDLSRRLPGRLHLRGRARSTSSQMNASIAGYARRSVRSLRSMLMIGYLTS